MTISRSQTLRSSTAGNRPAVGTRQPGELYTNWPDRQIGVIDSTQTPMDLLAVRVFSSLASYSAGQFVQNGSQLYAASTAVAPGAFNPAQWTKVALAGDAIGTRNLIMNGGMRIDQRNNGAALIGNAANGTFYPVDRWPFFSTLANRFSGQRIASATAGSAYALQIKTNTAAAPAAAHQNFLYQGLEGLNVAHLHFGSALAQTITISGIVNCSVAGSYSLVVTNGPTVNRCYVTSISVPAANTDTPFAVTVSGDTAGTWPTDTSGAMYVYFDLGSGSTATTATANTWLAGTYYKLSGTVNLVATANATLTVKDVQVELGTTATPFERRPIGLELDLCQRYYQRFTGASSGINLQGYGTSGTNSIWWIPISPPMRVAPTGSIIGTWSVISMPQPSILATLTSGLIIYGIATATGYVNITNPANGGFDLSADL
jgi:hypothetical protein